MPTVRRMCPVQLIGINKWRIKPVARCHRRMLSKASNGRVPQTRAPASDVFAAASLVPSLSFQLPCICLPPIGTITLFFVPHLNLILHIRFLLQLRALIEILRGNSAMAQESALPPRGIWGEEIEKAGEMLAAAKNNPSEFRAATCDPCIDLIKKFECLGQRLNTRMLSPVVRTGAMVPWSRSCSAHSLLYNAITD